MPKTMTETLMGAKMLIASNDAANPPARTDLPPLLRDEAVYVAVQGLSGPLHICAGSVGTVSPLRIFVVLHDEQVEQILCMRGVEATLLVLHEQPGQPTGYEPSGRLLPGQWCRAAELQR